MDWKITPSWKNTARDPPAPSPPLPTTQSGLARIACRTTFHMCIIAQANQILALIIMTLGCSTLYTHGGKREQTRKKTLSSKTSDCRLPVYKNN